MYLISQFYYILYLIVKKNVHWDDKNMMNMDEDIIEDINSYVCYNL